ncbi:MAG: YcxB family protein [Christensenellaceae bacterium]|jgi:glucan phosphoethanolaminetransferase (alkaline phosphatase superfamily)|nr:YcxB family protein [Christensenellaceae bacterium]
MDEKEILFTNRTQNTFEANYEFNKALLAQMLSVLTIVGLMFTVFGMVLFVPSLNKEEINTSSLGLLIGGIIILFLVFLLKNVLLKRNLKKVREKNGQTDESYFLYEFYEGSLKSEIYLATGKSGEDVAPLTSISKVIETPKFYFLFRIGSVGYIVDKSTFDSSASVAYFEKLQAKLGKKNYKVRSK